MEINLFSCKSHLLIFPDRTPAFERYFRESEFRVHSLKPFPYADNANVRVSSLYVFTARQGKYSDVIIGCYE